VIDEGGAGDHDDNHDGPAEPLMLALMKEMSGAYVIFDFVVVTRTVHIHTAYFHNGSGKILVGYVKLHLPLGG
jgi:hypothetical protein